MCSDDLVTLGSLARTWSTYPDLLEGLCRWYGARVVIRDRRRWIARGDVPDLRNWLEMYRTRPKLSRPKRRRKIT